LVAHAAIVIGRGRLGEFTVLVDDDTIFTSESDRTVARDGFSMHPRPGIHPRSFFAIGIDGDDGGTLILGAFRLHHAAITYATRDADVRGELKRLSRSVEHG